MAGYVNVFFDLAPRPTYQWGHNTMTKAPTGTPSLGDLRKEIDRIDEAMHKLLMERGEIINRLISVKNTQESGSAFRPAREADMMRRLVQRHHGILPLDTAESIWRVIIATFTHVQAPFSVHADLSAGDALFREMNAWGERYALATREASGEGLNPATREFRERVAEIAHNLTPEQEKSVADLAQRLVFNAPLGEKGRAVNNFVKTWHLEWAVPFISTPGNVFKEMARISPMADRKSTRLNSSH